LGFPSDYVSAPEKWTHVPQRLRPLIDAHIHLFPDPFFHAICQWFEKYAWKIKYRMGSLELIDFLLSKGFERVVGLHYSHKPGLAELMNDHMAGLCRARRELIGSATVFPGEDNASKILKKAFSQGLSCVKLHAHVQWVDLRSDAMDEIFQTCADMDRPIVIHAGREPRSDDFPYKWDPYEYCAAQRVQRVLRDFPKLKLCVPHMGADEFEAYESMIDKYDNLWLDTTMMLADFFPIEYEAPLARLREDRIMYGSDFPNIPYGWDVELRALDSMNLDENRLRLILRDNALDFFGMGKQ
jgi:hypothetical protein